MTLLQRVIEEAINPVGTGELNGNQLTVEITKIGMHHQGAKFTLNTDSPQLISNLERYEIEIPLDIRVAFAKGINAIQPAKIVSEPGVDAKGTEFNLALHAADENGKPILTKFKTFKKKVQ